jgi:hypothetical protein
MTGPPVVPAVPTVAEPNTYIEGRSFDWHIYRHGPNGERVCGAVGVCGRLDHAMERVLEELAEYATTAYAHIKVTFHTLEPEQSLVVTAKRNIDGEITWSFPH